MSFEPKPGMKLTLGEEVIEFTSLETNKPPSVFVYGEQGKEATVYRVRKDGLMYALKVFRRRFQNERLIKITKKLNSLKRLEGLQVAERFIIDRQSFPNLIEKYPELNYSILMPWMYGQSWGHLIEKKETLQFGDYLNIAQSLLRVAYNLEVRGLAHCDLSNNSFMIDPSLLSIQLIDLENLYSPDLPLPVPDVSYGTLGYRSRWVAENGLWSANSDRFAIAILCAEIVTWHNKEIYDNKARVDSFFDEEEIGRSSGRFNFMMYSLGRLNPDLSDLFQRAWFSSTLDQCPSISDWKRIIDTLDATTTA